MNKTFPDLSLFTLHETKHGVSIDGLDFPFMSGTFYRHVNTNGRTESIGVYAVDGKEIFAAWGHLDEKHCSYHALKLEGVWSEIQDGCPNLKLLDKKRIALCLNNKWHTFSSI